MSKLLLSTDTNTAKNLSRLSKQHLIRRVHHGIYTENLTDPIEKIVLQNWMQIVSYVVTDGILSYRSALELKPTVYENGLNIVFMISSYAKTITLPGLIINITKGDNRSYTEKVLPSLDRTNIPRSLLENLTVVRKRSFQGIKTLGKEDVEQFLAKELRLRKEERLNQLRDEAKSISVELGLHSEYLKLNEIISALLSTHPDVNYLKTDYAKAIAKKEPFDAKRLQLFEQLSLYIQKCQLRERYFKYDSKSFKNLSFFESYFSNYIEGTKFLIEEAEDIVFSRTEIKNRHADSHDVMANFDLTNDYSEMSITPQNPQEFLEILKRRHEYLMKERFEKNPGKFKEKPNKAGDTYFVEPEDVIGTLTQGFEIYKILNPGYARALFMHFMVSEVHPFSDGNGRLSRIMMNAELVQANITKIIIPTVHRDNYLSGLRRATRDYSFQVYCKVVDQAQAYTQSIDWSDYGAAKEKIENDQADKSSDEGIPKFNRTLRTLELSDFPN